MATINRIGFGQVEPNHLSAQRTGRIYAQLPAAKAIEVLENGQFVKYDYPNKEVNYTGAGAWMLVFNEVKLYDGWRESYKDFAMIKDNYTEGGKAAHYGVGPFEGQMTPRVLGTELGDIFTTNCLEKANTSGKAVVEGTEDYAVGDVLAPNANGYLSKAAGGSATDNKWQIAEIYTVPDGQAAVKIVRIA